MTEMVFGSMIALSSVPVLPPDGPLQDGEVVPHAVPDRIVYPWDDIWGDAYGIDAFVVENLFDGREWPTDRG
jgi:hypothetical protein